MHILVIGYYHRCNLGDDVFEYVFSKFFEQCPYKGATVNILNIDDVIRIPNETSMVIFGGGDLINDYFMKKLWKLIDGVKCPIYAVGVGIPYPQLIHKGYLDCFDFVIHRNQTDTELLQKIYGPTRVRNCPDISCLLQKYVPEQKKTKNIPIALRSIHPSAKRIGICLARPIRNKNDETSYSFILQTLVAFFLRISREKQPKSKFKKCFKSKCCATEDKPLYELFFIPFSTDKNPNQDDRQINNDIYQHLLKEGGNEMNNIHVIEDKIEIETILPIFRSFHMTVCTRFHAHVFSIMAETPLLSIYSSRKVENLLFETLITDYAHKMTVHPETLHPVKIDEHDLAHKFTLVQKNYETYKQTLKMFNHIYCYRAQDFVQTLNNLLFYKIKHLNPLGIKEKAIQQARLISNRLISYFDLIPSPQLVNNLMYKEGHMHDTFHDISEATPTNLSHIISYTLTCEKSSDYIYGLIEQVMTSNYTLIGSCEWIICHYEEHHAIKDKMVMLKNDTSLCSRSINAFYVKQHGLEGYHRSGWNYVVQNLNKLHNINGPIFDSYADKTFGWDYEFLSKICFLPYEKPWMGVFHHTTNKTYSENNLIQVFRKPLFIKSLTECVGLFVLSEHLKDWICEQLKTLSLPRSIPVYVLTHPTETPKNHRFDWYDYLDNQEKKVIQIGGWLRDTYAIYQLHTPPEFQKCALKGKGMDNYFIHPQDLYQIQAYLVGMGVNENGVGVDCSGMCKNTKSNKYIAGLADVIKNQHNSVTILDTVPNEKYDVLLSKNIVFIKLVDAAAVNTIIECIVRHTPILVNRLPATIEYLGPKYPLFYSSLEEASQLLGCEKSILKSHRYLKLMDKKRFHIDYFMNYFVSLTTQTV